MFVKDVKPGMVVRLASGGPAMTVANWDEDIKSFHCTWFDGGTMNSDPFYAEELVPGAPPPVADGKPVPAVIHAGQLKILMPNPEIACGARYYWDDPYWMVEESMAETEERVKAQLRKEGT